MCAYQGVGKRGQGFLDLVGARLVVEPGVKPVVCQLALVSGRDVSWRPPFPTTWRLREGICRHIDTFAAPSHRVDLVPWVRFMLGLFFEDNHHLVLLLRVRELVD